jgi:hypothetical protein
VLDHIIEVVLTAQCACSYSTQATSTPTQAAAADTNMFIDEAAELAKSTFPIKPAELIKRAKYVLGPGVEVGMGDATALADDFRFVAPVVGPLGKDEYLGALKNFDIKTVSTLIFSNRLN